jgi:hypothetical protein
MLYCSITRLLASFLVVVWLCSTTFAQTTIDVRPEVLTPRALSWTGQQSVIPCPLTAASTITLNLSACPTAGDSPSVFTITLTSNTIFALPSPFPTNEVFFNLAINHGTGPYTARLATGWYLQAGQMTGNQPTLSTTANANDELACHTVPSTQQVWCGALVTMTPASIVTFSQAKIGTGVTSGTTVTVTLTSPMTAGQGVYCGVAQDANVAPTSVASGGNTLTLLDTTTVGVNHFVGTYALANVTGTPQTFTATFAATLTGAKIGCAAYNGVTAIGNHTINTQGNGAGGTDFWVSGNITPTNVNDIIVSIAVTTASSNPSAGTNFTSRATDPSPSGGVYAMNIEDLAAPNTSSLQATWSGLSGLSTSMATSVLDLH